MAAEHAVHGAAVRRGDHRGRPARLARDGRVLSRARAPAATSSSTTTMRSRNCSRRCTSRPTRPTRTCCSAGRCCARAAPTTRSRRLRMSLWSREGAAARLALAEALVAPKQPGLARAEAMRALLLDPSLEAARALIARLDERPAAGREPRAAGAAGRRRALPPSGTEHAVPCRHVGSPAPPPFLRRGSCARPRLSRGSSPGQAQPPAAGDDDGRRRARRSCPPSTTASSTRSPPSSSTRRSRAPRSAAPRSSCSMLRTPGGLLDSTRTITSRMIASQVAGGRLHRARRDRGRPRPGSSSRWPPTWRRWRPARRSAPRTRSPATARRSTTPSRRRRRATWRRMRGPSPRSGAATCTLAEQAVVESRAFTDEEARAADAPARGPRRAGPRRPAARSSTAARSRRFDGSRTVLHTEGASVERVEMTWRQRLLSAHRAPADRLPAVQPRARSG